MVDQPTSLRRKIVKSLPNTPWVRVPLGIVLIILGVFGFLPVLGFWMIPVGLIVLSPDFPPARRLARRMILFIGRITKSIRRSWSKSGRNP